MPLLAKKPGSVLRKKLNVKDWGDFWKACGASIAHAGSAKFDELLQDLVDVGASLGLAEEPGEVAWLLIRRALGRALRDLIREHRDLFASFPPETNTATEAAAGLTIEDEVLEIDETFFRAPDTLPLLKRLQEPLANWLVAHGVQRPAAGAIAERLRAYFVSALHDEWGSAPSDYAKVREALDTPFTRAHDLERAWLRYEAHLRRQVNEPLFAEAFGLSAVYVPLRAYYESSVKLAAYASHAEHADSDDDLNLRVIVDLRTELDGWMAAQHILPRLRVLSGGPGSGKSSFTKIHAAHTMASGNVRALYIPLHLFDHKGDLVSAVGEFVRTTGILPSNPLEPGTGDERRPLLLLFDGLDELAMQGRLAADTARDFVREVERTYALHGTV